MELKALDQPKPRPKSRRKFNLLSPKGIRVAILPLVILGLGTFLGYRQVASRFVQPEVILVLGGEPAREKFAVEFARSHPDTKVWVSSGSPEDYTKMLFDKAGIARQRLHIDRRALDTVTNFTTLVDEFHRQGISSVYLVTSDDHMGRAQVVGEIVFGSRGIIIKPLPLSSGREPEPGVKSVRDGARAIIWLFTGMTGASLLHHD